MITIRRTLLASVAAAGIVLGFSSAAGALEVINFNPGGSNNNLLALDPGSASIGPVTGGLGALYDSVNTPSGSTGSYTGDMVINLTSLDGLSGTGLASNWELFAIVTMSGTNVSSGSPAFDIQVYGVNTTEVDFTGTHGYTSSGASCNTAPSSTCFNKEGATAFHDPGTSSVLHTNTGTGTGKGSGGGLTLDSDQSVSVTDMATMGDLNVGDRSASEFSGNLVEPDGSVGDSTGTTACIDESTGVSGGNASTVLNGSPSTTISGQSAKANCILLAYGTNAAGSDSSFSISGGNETFSLDADLTIASYALGGNGFFAGDPSAFDLTINSGPSGIGIDGVTDPGTTWTANGGDVVNWGLPGTVPEPGSLALMGTALAGFAAARRRKRKHA